MTQSLNDPPESSTVTAYESWIRGLPEEISYWRGYIQGRGGDYADDFAFRLRGDTWVRDRDPVLAETLESLGVAEPNLLDVGAGPLTNLGKQLSSARLTIQPCDPLADVYGWLLDEAGVRPPVRTLFADAENLAMYFPHDSFDAVHCANALDHSYDPLAGILEMLKVVKSSGFIHLGHFENEAEHEQYAGLHQWNITERDGDLVFWNRHAELSLRGIGGAALEVTTRGIPLESGRRWILAQIRKRPGVETLYALRPANLPTKYRLLLAEQLRKGLDHAPEPTATVETSSPAGLRARLGAWLRAKRVG